MEINYFSCLCFGWATVGIITRVLMVVLGDKWNKWEMDHAYTEKKPAWVDVVVILGFVLVVYTWYQVFTSDVKYGWIMGVLVSLTLTKILALQFNYDKFREFASAVLNDPRKKRNLNIFVFLVSVVFILLGVYVY